jgi:hypothetical protein
MFSITRKRIVVSLYGLLAIIVAASGCSSDSQAACTTLFATSGVVVLDSVGAPVSGIVVTDTVVRTGHSLVIAQFPTGILDGHATVFTDAEQGDVLASGDAVVATGTLGVRSFRASFVFGSDGCHLQKISGPDTVVVR